MPGAQANLWASIESKLASPLGKTRSHPRSHWLLALMVSVLAACLYISLVVWNDNTNVGTSNGLWKSVNVSRWAHETGLPLDSGEILYPAVYGRLALLIPDSLVSYGTPALDLTFRKMAILNAIFGGIATGLVFLLGLRCIGKWWLAAMIALAHAGAGFVLLNSINSEDIIPAYALFLGATVCFFEFLHTGGIVLFASSTLLLALATLFHWTVMAPALASFGAVYAVLLFKDRKFLGLGLAWLVLFLVWVQFLVLLFFPYRLIPVWAAVYPEKANAGGWVGLLKQKFWYLLVGAGNYFSGAANVGDYRAVLQRSDLLRHVYYSWIAWLVALAGCVATLFRRKSGQGMQLLAIAALALFLVGELGALYSQPQDPQMQIEPMLMVVEGLILVGAMAAAAGRRIWQAALACVLAPVALVNGYSNVHLLSKERGSDSKATAGIRELDRLFPKNQSMYVSQGFEIWVNWQFVLLWPGEFTQYTKRNVLLTEPFVAKRGISAEAAAAEVEKQIDGALAAGVRVVAGSVWTLPLEESAASFATVTNESTAKSYLDTLEKRYPIGARWDTLNGPFVELKAPRAASAPAL